MSKNLAENLQQNKTYIAVELFVFIAIFVIFTFVFPSSATPFLVLLAFVSLRLRKLKWRDIGFFKPPSFVKTLGIALGLGIVFQAFSTFLFVPSLETLTGETLDLSQFAAVQGNYIMLAIWLAIVWTLAAFGEEVVYRGYAMSRLAGLIGGDKAWWISLALVSIFFGLAHSYQGWIGIIDTGMMAVVFGISYLLANRNIWLPILFHGFYDTVGFLFIFYGIIQP